MFTLSTKSDYGLLLLSLLAKEKNTRFSISTIAKRYELPYSFLSRIASELVAAGILTSKEGVGGGYKMAKKSKDVKLSDVIKTLDGPFVPTKCTGNKGQSCRYESICVVKNHWQHHLQNQIWRLFSSYSLDDIMR